jgi:hypothetical protein
VTQEWTAPQPGERLIDLVVAKHEPDDLPFDPDWHRIADAYRAAEREAIKEVTERKSGVLVTGVRGSISAINEFHHQAREAGLTLIHVDSLKLAMEWYETLADDGFVTRSSVDERKAIELAKQEITDALADYREWETESEIEAMNED